MVVRPDALTPATLPRERSNIQNGNVALPFCVYLLLQNHASHIAPTLKSSSVSSLVLFTRAGAFVVHLAGHVEARGSMDGTPALTAIDSSGAIRVSFQPQYRRRCHNQRAASSLPGGGVNVVPPGASGRTMAL